MSDLGDLETRLDAATGRIVAALTALAEKRQTPDAPGDAAAVAELRAENTALAEALAKLKEDRARDVAEIDTLISQLKPLVEEV